MSRARCRSSSSTLIGMVARYDAQRPRRPDPGRPAAWAKVGSSSLCSRGGGVVGATTRFVGPIGLAGLDGRVSLLGPRLDTPDILAGLDVAVLATHGEAFGMVLVEAMACGVPSWSPTSMTAVGSWATPGSSYHRATRKRWRPESHEWRTSLPKTGVSSALARAGGCSRALRSVGSRGSTRRSTGEILDGDARP